MPAPLRQRQYHFHAHTLSTDYAQTLLQSLGARRTLPAFLPPHAEQDRQQDWEASGLMPLCGHPEQALTAGPGAIPSCANGALEALRQISGKPVLADYCGAHLLSERAALLHLKRQGCISANGSCRLMQTACGNWLAVNLAREDDWSLLQAWFCADQTIADWDAVIDHVRQQSAAVLLERSQLLGLPVARLAEITTSDSWYRLAFQGMPRSQPPAHQPLVLDLSSLWAGPLCGQLLRCGGARVIKIESQQRPDGARFGNKDFYNLLNAGKQSLALDFGNPSHINSLRQLIMQADIVIEGSRPRALQQLGIHAEPLLMEKPGLIWLGISGYGRSEPQAERVAFGDDAAIAAGIVEWYDNEPFFCGDAIADPLTGLHAALAALAFFQAGRAVLVDIALSHVAAYCRGYYSHDANDSLATSNTHHTSRTHDKTVSAHMPPPRHSQQSAAEPGQHNELLAREFSLPC